MKKLVLISAALLTATLCHADVIAGWDVAGIDVADGTGIDEGVAPYRFTAPTTDGNITLAQLSLGSGVAPSTSASTYGYKIAIGDTQTDLAGAIANGHYFEFAITVAAGFRLNLSSIEMYGESSSTGVDDVALMSSINGYTAGNEIAALTGIAGVTGGFDTDGTGWGAPIDLSAVQYQNLTGTISFRVYGYNSSSGAGSTSLRSLSGDDLIVNGTTQAIPEPSTAALVGLAALAVLARRRGKS